MATLALKNPVSVPLVSPKVRKKRVVDFSGYKARTVQSAPPKRAKISLEDIGIFAPHLRTVGEDMLIVRAARDKFKFDEIPEEFTIIEFANTMQLRRRYGCPENHLPHKGVPRYAQRQHFDARIHGDEMKARKHIREWANRYLTDLFSTKIAA